jgi:CPSF A subunit region
MENVISIYVVSVAIIAPMLVSLVGIDFNTSKNVGSLNGSISMVTPITEKTYKRLLLLYGQLVNGLQHVAGLNPRAFR